MTKAKKSQKGISPKHWLGYMFGDFGGCMTFALMTSIVTRYYTNVLKINDDILFILIMIWNVWDAINDPLMGTLMDKMFVKSKNPKGKFRPWILRATPLVAVTAIAFWTLPTFYEGTKMLVVLFLCKILYEVLTRCSISPWALFLLQCQQTTRKEHHFRALAEWDLRWVMPFPVSLALK